MNAPPTIWYSLVLSGLCFANDAETCGLDKDHIDGSLQLMSDMEDHMRGVCGRCVDKDAVLVCDECGVAFCEDCSSKQHARGKSRRHHLHPYEITFVAKDPEV